MAKKLPPPDDSRIGQLEDEVRKLQRQLENDKKQPAPPKELDDALRTILKAPPPKKEKPK